MPDLSIGRFGGQHSYFSNPLPPSLRGQSLQQLVTFAVKAYKGTPPGEFLREALISDGFNLEPASKVDSSVPPELAKIPGEKALVSDIQQILPSGSNDFAKAGLGAPF